MHMLRKIKDLQKYILSAKDGSIGKAGNFYFDDDTWTVRYLAANGNSWLLRRHILISPIALQNVDDNAKRMLFDISLEQLRKCPQISSDKPISRGYETTLYRYYGWPSYWQGEDRWGRNAYPIDRMMPGTPAKPSGNTGVLLNIKDIAGYRLVSETGDIGQVEDFVVDDETWALRYLVVDTRHLWPDKEVLISPQWIDRIVREEKTLSTGLASELIRNAPEYDPASVITRRYELGLFRYYGREQDVDAVHVGKKLVLAEK
jgi:hypothetical protein